MKQRSIASTLWRLLGFGRPHLGVVWAAFGCMAVLGITTGLFAWAMGPALRFLLTGGGEGLELVFALLPALATVDRAQLLWLFPLTLIGVAVVKGAAYLGQFYYGGLFGQLLVANLRRTLFVQLTQMSPVQLARHRLGDLLGRFAADTAYVEFAAFYTVSAYVRDGLQLIVLVIVAFALDWRLALGALVIVPLAAAPAMFLSRSNVRKTRESTTRLGNLAAQLQEGLGGLSTLQVFNAQARELERFDREARLHERARIKAGWARGAVPGVMELLAAAALAGALGWAALNGITSPERLISLLTALLLAYQPIKELGRVTQFAIQAAAAGERLFAVLDSPASVEDSAGAVQAPPLARDVRFEGVRFSYGDRPALERLDLVIPTGKVTALVGPSGGGKSTVTSLLLRFERAQAGRLLLDGESMERFTSASVRAQFAYVSQEPRLFSGTVAENLALAKPGALLSELKEAARIAHAAEFIEALPEGYDTPLGERGVRLSGGQRQRICLARAALSQAPVLILDEATSNLDPQSEREVQTALADVLKGRTAVVIAHRLSTIAEADFIHVLENGRILESGTHDSLVAKRGRYAELWALQQGPVPGASAA